MVVWLVALRAKIYREKLKYKATNKTTKKSFNIKKDIFGKKLKFRVCCGKYNINIPYQRKSILSHKCMSVKCLLQHTATDQKL